jgi:type I restriction enzyme S subunit
MVKPWDTATIGDFLDFKNGLNKGKEFFGYGTPIVNYTDVYKKRGLTKNDVRGKVNLTRDEIHRFDARKNDVFFTRTSETPEEVGMSSVLLDDIDDCVFSGFVLRGRPKNDMFTPEYCKYCFTTEAVRNAITMGCTYTTRALTNGKQLSAIEIVVPSKPEQEAIAQSLTDIDELILSLEKLVAKTKAIKQGAMQELLTGKKRLPGFPGEWETRTLHEISNEMVDGPFGSNLKTEHYTTERQVRIIQLSNIGEAGWNNANVKYTTFSHAAELQRCIVQPGSILIAKMMPAGRAIICPDNEKSYILGSDVVKVVPNSSVDSRYLVYATKSRFYLDQIADDTQGSTRARTSVSKLRKTAILFPEKDEQIAIADILSEMDMEIAALEGKIAKYRQIKQGMMQQLLTGKIRLV